MSAATLSTATLSATAVDFVLPEDLHASAPAEARGLERDEVKLLVSDGGAVTHGQFWELGRHLRAGDLLVVNTSGTLAAAVDGILSDGRRVGVHFSAPTGDGTWVVELRQPDRSGPVLDAYLAQSVALAGGASIVLAGAHHANADGSVRLWRAIPQLGMCPPEWLALHGRPISYRYLDGSWPIGMYQTVFANEPGSAEMPSAGRPFSHRLVTELVSAGVGFAPILLHTGVSSLEAHEPPQAERFEVTAHAARLINATRANGGRVIAVGTTATRAVETVAEESGLVREGGGWTELVLSAGRPARAVDGVISGWHEPGASHLHLLEAVAGHDVVVGAYEQALQHGYLWHEFGDSALLLR